ncbi:MAG: hypothetical protein NTX52_11265 [Planctomycetota bacterium]|nr:hypothetical protein [Planctomycetota bacterium]
MTTATLLLGMLIPVALIAFTLYSSFVLTPSKGMPGQACTERPSDALRAVEGRPPITTFEGRPFDILRADSQ